MVVNFFNSNILLKKKNEGYGLESKLNCCYPVQLLTNVSFFIVYI